MWKVYEMEFIDMGKHKEHKIQEAFIELARYYLADTGFICFSIPNQGEGSARQGAKFKREGRLAGVPDVFIAWPRLGYHGLFIEFKCPQDPVTKRGKTYLSKEQKKIIPLLREAGYCVAVSRDAFDAYDILKRYALGSDPDLVLGDYNLK